MNNRNTQITSKLCYKNPEYMMTYIPGFLL